MIEKDTINPRHYRNPYGVQLIDIIRYMPFSIGNAIKYCYRNENKNSSKDDLNKALWYLNDYKSCITTCSDSEKLTDDLFKKVFDGVNKWEYDCCYEIYALYKIISYSKEKKFTEDNLDFKKMFDKIEDTIRDRIKTL